MWEEKQSEPFLAAPVLFESLLLPFPFGICPLGIFLNWNCLEAKQKLFGYKNDPILHFHIRTASMLQILAVHYPHARRCVSH